MVVCLNTLKSKMQLARHGDRVVVLPSIIVALMSGLGRVSALVNINKICTFIRYMECIMPAYLISN